MRLSRKSQFDVFSFPAIILRDHVDVRLSNRGGDRYRQGVAHVRQELLNARRGGHMSLIALAAVLHDARH